LREVLAVAEDNGWMRKHAVFVDALLDDYEKGMTSARLGESLQMWERQ
jgi:hypothetical protein